LVGHKRHSRQQRAVNVLRQLQVNRLPRVALYALKRHRLARVLVRCVTVDSFVGRPGRATMLELTGQK